MKRIALFLFAGCLCVAGFAQESVKKAERDVERVVERPEPIRGIQHATPPNDEQPVKPMESVSSIDKNLEGTAWFGKTFGLYFKDEMVYWINENYEYKTELPIKRLGDGRKREDDEPVPSAIVYSYNEYGSPVGFQVKSVSKKTIELQSVSRSGHEDRKVTLKKQKTLPTLFSGVRINGTKLQGMWWCEEYNVGVYFVDNKAYFVDKDYTYSMQAKWTFQNMEHTQNCQATAQQLRVILKSKA